MIGVDISGEDICPNPGAPGQKFNFAGEAAAPAVRTGTSTQSEQREGSKPEWLRRDWRRQTGQRINVRPGDKHAPQDRNAAAKAGGRFSPDAVVDEQFDVFNFRLAGRFTVRQADK